MHRNRRYWDSNIFLTVLEAEPLNYPKCKGVIEAVKRKEVQIVTSALTLTEVLYIKGHPKITKEKSQKIVDLFKIMSIIVVNVDRKIAEMARDYVWNHDVRPKDAIHLASATYAKIATFDTFDKDLLKLSLKLGNPPLAICEPNIPYQEKLEGIS